MAPDPRESRFIYIVGRKGSGKSEYAKRWFYSYPLDRLVIDVTHDVTESLRADGIPHHQLQVPLPGSWPDWMRGEDEGRQMTLVYRPDMGEPDALDNIDRCIALCLRGRDPGTGRIRPALAWADEIGEVAPVHGRVPAMKRALHHGRHNGLSLLMCGPEAKNVLPLCIAQADEVIAFRMLRAEHRKVLADNVGYGQDEFDAMNESLARYEHMRWTTESETFEHMAPIPLWRRGRNEMPPVPAD